MTVHFVRHGAPLVDPGVPPHEWVLDPARLPELDALADSDVLPATARWCASDEPKSLQTAQRLAGRLGAGDVERVPGLREQRRPAGWVEDFASKVHRSLLRTDEPAAEGWEVADAVRSRVVATVRALADTTTGQDLVLVGSATAWVLAVGEITGRGPDLAAWERLRMPDHCCLDGAGVVSPWGRWDAVDGHAGGHR